MQKPGLQFYQLALKYYLVWRRENWAAENMFTERIALNIIYRRNHLLLQVVDEKAKEILLQNFCFAFLQVFLWQVQGALMQILHNV